MSIISHSIDADLFFNDPFDADYYDSLFIYIVLSVLFYLILAPSADPPYNC